MRTSHGATRLRAVSLFSNCGAGDLGFAGAGFRFDVMGELDPRRLSIALLNHPGAHKAVAGGQRGVPTRRVLDAYIRKAGDQPPALFGGLSAMPRPQLRTECPRARARPRRGKPRSAEPSRRCDSKSSAAAPTPSHRCRECPSISNSQGPASIQRSLRFGG